MAGGTGQGWRRLINASRYSAQGLRAAWQNEAAFRQELIASIVLIPVALWLGSSALERSVLVGSLLLVWIVELVNSAIEAVVDRTGTERHELSGRAKDIGSAAVMIALINVAVIWLLFLLERFAA